MLKKTNSTTKPRTAGMAPSSPPRTRRKYARSAAPREYSSFLTPTGATGGAGVVVGRSVLAMARSSDLHLVDGLETEITRTPRGDQFDHLRVRGLAAQHLGGDAAEIERDDAVGHFEHVVHVVGDEHDTDALIGQP